MNSLKIDRAFVSSAQLGDRNRVIVESIIALSDLLAINAIAEGIETPQQLAWLQALGCESGQGYFFSPAHTGRPGHSDHQQQSLSHLDSPTHRSREILVVKLIPSDFTSEFSMVSDVAAPEHKFSGSINS